MNTVFNGKDVIIPMADIVGMEKKVDSAGRETLVGLNVIMNKTKWNFDHDCWENSIWVSNCEGQADLFLKEFLEFRERVDGDLILNDMLNQTLLEEKEKIK